MLLVSSSTLNSPLYVFAGGKWVRSLDPSWPSHQKVECGKRLVSFQLIFWVIKAVTPAWRAICGNAAEYPNTSGIQHSCVSTPNSSPKNRLPYTNCRTSDSPDGRLLSDSTHMPPTGSHRPSAIRALICRHSDGYPSLIHWYWTAWLQAKRCAG